MHERRMRGGEQQTARKARRHHHRARLRATHPAKSATSCWSSTSEPFPATGLKYHCSSRTEPAPIRHVDLTAHFPSCLLKGDMTPDFAAYVQPDYTDADCLAKHNSAERRQPVVREMDAQRDAQRWEAEMRPGNTLMAGKLEPTHARRGRP